jgi:hypothetical protein
MIESPRMTISHKRNPAWEIELIQDAEKYGDLEGTMRQSKKPKPFSNYMALMCDLVEKEPTCFEEVVQEKEWMDVMTEGYQSIMKIKVEDRKTHVWKLNKSLYGLKQAPRSWYGRIDSFLTSLGFTKSKDDSNLYFKVMNDDSVILLLYVDDLFLNGEENLITYCKKKLATEFEMKDLGLMHYFLGLEVWKIPEKIFLNQGKYAVETLKRFDMLECKSMNTPMETKLLVYTSSELVDVTLYRQIIGSLMYVMNTRPDICFVVNTLIQYLVDPRRVHLVDAKHVMRYLKSMLDYGLYYTGDHDFKLYGYIDSHWAGSASGRKSTSRCCFNLGLAMTSWKSRKQSSISLSTTEAEYIATCSTSCEAIWIQKLLTGLFDLEMEATVILCDNQSCIKMMENPVFHDKSKHIEIWYYYICDMVQRGAVKL